METRMETRQAVHYEQAETLDTDGLRRHFLIEDVFAPGEIRATYTHYDRLVVLGISPLATPLTFGPDLARIAGVADFLERREIALINIGAGLARIVADGETFEIGNEEALYIGRGATRVAFAAPQPAPPGQTYSRFAPAPARPPPPQGTQAPGPPPTPRSRGG